MPKISMVIKDLQMQLLFVAAKKDERIKKPRKKCHDELN